jgi:hypothetical protein
MCIVYHNTEISVFCTWQFSSARLFKHTRANTTMISWQWRGCRLTPWHLLFISIDRLFSIVRYYIVSCEKTYKTPFRWSNQLQLRCLHSRVVVTYPPVLTILRPITSVLQSSVTITNQPNPEGSWVCSGNPHASEWKLLEQLMRSPEYTFYCLYKDTTLLKKVRRSSWNKRLTWTYKGAF